MDNIKTKLPPSDLEAEKNILSAILLDNDAILNAMDIIKPDDFYSRANHNIFACMLSLFEKSTETDILTLANELKNNSLYEASGGKEYLESLCVLVPSSAAVGAYCHMVRRKSVLRQLIKASTHILENCYDESKEVSEVLDQAEQSVFEVAETKSQSGTKHISDVIDASFKQIESLFDKKQLIPGLTTGFKKIDQLIGGLQKTQLLIVAARPGMGKTSFCLNIAINTAIQEQSAVLVFSLEMSCEELGVRMLCSNASVNSQKIKTGYWSDKDWDKLTNAAARLCDTNILIDDSPGLNILEVRARARRAKASHPNLGLIIVDYLQLMRGIRTNMDRHLEIAEISRSLKALAKELDIPVIALSQLSRKVEERGDKKPQLSDLRESGSIEQDADIVMFINRPEMYDRDNPEVSNIAEIDVAKNRSGPTGSCSLTFLKEFTRFENIAYEDSSMSPSFDAITDMSLDAPGEGDGVF
ncbi:MAG: replicative DNA helicase [Nitrospinae bacterium]|nr:replicative DNA helicase [Nitrospinota bacterium]